MPTNPADKSPQEFAEKLRQRFHEQMRAQKLSPFKGLFKDIYLPSIGPSKKITTLRKAGKIKAALNYAHKSLKEDPKNDLTKSALAWIHYDYLKKYVLRGQFDKFEDHLNKIKELRLTKSGTMLFDNTALLIAHMVLALQKSTPVEYKKISILFHLIREFKFTKPSDPYLFLFEAFHQANEGWSEYTDFVDWWDTDHFRPEDYDNPEDPNDRSIVEQTYIAYSNKLLTAKPRSSESKTTHHERIRAFISKLDAVIQEYPQFQHLFYQKARLQLIVEDRKSFLSEFIATAQQKRREFWVWYILAMALNDDKSLALACFCKAKSLINADDCPKDIYRDFISFLIKRKRYPEAKSELDEFMAKCDRDRVKVSSQFAKWTKQKWYKNTGSRADNQPFYNQHIPLAEDFLFNDVPQVVLVIEFVNRNRSMAHFVIDKNRYGLFKYSGKIDEPKVGEVYRTRLKGDNDGDRFELYTATKMDPSTPTKALRSFKSKLTVIPPHNYGMANKIYFDPELIRKHHLDNGQKVAGRAMLSLHKKTKEWRWKAVEIE